jgi:16S rRNA (uracil1498-N3)-methyltransferase
MITALVEAGMVRVGALLELDSGEAHHLQVRRVESGERIRLLDGRGGVGVGVVSLNRKQARVEVVEAVQVERPSALALAVGGGDRDRFTWLVEKAAEIGVTDLIPLETERTANVGTRVRPTHIDKLQSRALEAIKQSGAAWAPAIHRPLSLPEVLAFAGLKLVAEQGSMPLARFDANEEITCLIGPEGGWTARETDLLAEHGCTFVRLSPNVLRFETAALALAVLVQDRRHPMPHPPAPARGTG